MIYVCLADGFEEIEALTPVDLLRRAGKTVITVGIGDRAVTGSHGIPVLADIDDAQIATDGLEAVILPGGMPGTLHLEQSAAVQRLLDYAVAHDLLIGAICAAPSILGHKGLLRGKRATCFPGFEEQLDGATVCGDAVVTDGRIVTACGAGAAVDFGLRLVGELVSEEQARALRAGIQCR